VSRSLPGFEVIASRPTSRYDLAVRYWLPLLAAAVCLIAATRVPAVAAYILIVAAFALVFDVSTKLFEQSGRGGRLTDHRQ
jgi:hypothetical protein